MKTHNDRARTHTVDEQDLFDGNGAVRLSSTANLWAHNANARILDIKLKKKKIVLSNM